MTWIIHYGRYLQWCPSPCREADIGSDGGY